jgi:hypothetical protein
LMNCKHLALVYKQIAEARDSACAGFKQGPRSRQDK